MALPRTRGRRVAVTGLGVISPIGNTVSLFWNNLLAGRSGIQPISSFDSSDYPAHMAGLVQGFDPEEYLDRQQARRADRFAQFGVAAAHHALDDSGLVLDDATNEGVGVSLGTAVAGLQVVERETLVLAQHGPRRISPMLIPSVIGNMAGCLLSIQLKLQGPVLCPTGACATGCMAVGDALHLIRGGSLEAVFAGGADSMVTPVAVAAFGRLGALSRRADDPSLSCRPFDVDRDGTVLAEGAGVLIMESEEHAKERGANILAEVAGYGICSDAYHIAAPDPNGHGAARSMRAALRSAGAEPAEVDFVVAHGTGTPLNDISESKAIRVVFGDHADRMPVASNKYAIGHTLGAAGALSAIVAVQAIRHGIAPGTLNLRQKDPECVVNAISTNVEADIATVLVNAFGFGGQNASLLIRRWVD